MTRLINRSHKILSILTEAHGYDTPRVRSHQDLIDQVARLLWENPHDIRAAQLLYAYFMAVGHERMMDTLQDLGHYIVDKYRIPFEETEALLNMTVRRLAHIGHERSMQWQAQPQAQQHPRPIQMPKHYTGPSTSPAHMMRGEVPLSRGEYHYGT